MDEKMLDDIRKCCEVLRKDLDYDVKSAVNYEV